MTLWRTSLSKLVSKLLSQEGSGIRSSLRVCSCSHGHVEDPCDEDLHSYFFRNSFALIRSDDRQALAALGGLTIEVDHMNGVEPENSGDVIHVDDDSAFSAYRDNAEDSDSSDVEG